MISDSEKQDNQPTAYTDEESEMDAHIDEYAKPRVAKVKIPIKIRFKKAFTGLDLKTWFWFGLIVFIILLTVVLTIKLVQDSSWMFGLVLKYFIRPIVTLGGWGIVLFFIFMALQGVIAPLPSELMLLACGLLWGLWIGTGMAIAGLLLTAALCYEIGIRGGKPVAEKFIGDDLYVVDYYMYKYGNPTLLISRAIPAIPFDHISFAAGFLGIKRRDYYLTTLIGSIPRSLFFTFIGSKMNSEDRPIIEVLSDPELLDEFIKTGSAQFNTLILCAAVVLILMFLIYKFWLAKYLKWKRVQNEIAELEEGGHLEEYGFSQYTMEAILSGEIPPEAHQIMGLFIQTDKEGKILLKETIQVMSQLILERAIPEEMDDVEIHYPDAQPDDRLWLRLAKSYRLVLKDVFKSKDADMIAHMLEGLGHCYYKLGHKQDAGQIFNKSMIIYHQAGERDEARRVQNFFEKHFEKNIKR
ncbi:MAG: TVP38/TMEM64 family protein [Candidatus Lokiarchaeota archaeon]|nr:TVP38/TMEM64 family protein [Candidatus Lokiarchaeota archaeon]